MGTVTSYLGEIARSMRTVFEGMAVTMSWMFRKPVTVQYPYHPKRPERKIGGPETLPERYRGFLEVETGICTACLACERACPIGCIVIDVEKVTAPNDPDAKPQRMVTRFDIDLAKCMYCGLCSEPCPTEAIRHTPHFEASVANVANLVARFVHPGEPFLPYKLKKGEEIPKSPVGSIAERILVDRPWDAPAPALSRAVDEGPTADEAA